MTSLIPQNPQKILNGEFHNWYRTILCFSDQLVVRVLGLFDVKPGDRVLDPFCGAGTTLVECKKRGIDSVGIDANPASCFASRVKTNWRLGWRRVLELLDELLSTQSRYLRKVRAYRGDPTYRYLESSGMLARGWISPEPLRKAIAMKHAIRDLRTSPAHRRLLMLALISQVVHGSSNVKFGPELYCGPRKLDSDVYSGFAKRVRQMASDLQFVRPTHHTQAVIVKGDSRACASQLRDGLSRPYDVLISSPPYPTEHDYTRNTRLELAFLEEVSGVPSLRRIKQQMIRSHTKGIYTTDDDSALVSDDREVCRIAAHLEKKAQDKKDGFSRYYPVVVREYFGGMKRHLLSVWEILRPRARCAYVLGDQSSYHRVHIPTARILGRIAKQVGFDVLDIMYLRARWSTTTSKAVGENVLLLRRKP